MTINMPLDSKRGISTMTINAHEKRAATQWLLRQAAQALPSAQRWDYLIAAHIAGQTQMQTHLQTHIAMLSQAWQERDAREIMGQALRLTLVPFGHALQRLPLGNTGRSRISAFEPMPINPLHRDLIEQAIAQSGLN
jgi:Protein of unknown function (DUF3703)